MLEERYGITIYSIDGKPIKDEELLALIPVLEQLPPSLQTGADMQGNEDPYVFLFHVPREAGHEHDAYMWTGGVFGEIVVNELTACEDRFGLTCGTFQDMYVHEILHNHDTGKVQSSFCGVEVCETLDAFMNAARLDGISFTPASGPDVGFDPLTGALLQNSSPLTLGPVQISDAANKGDSQWFVDNAFPRQEMYAYLGSRYVTNPEFIRINYPNLYNFYNESVFEGVEYTQTTDDQGKIIIQAIP